MTPLPRRGGIATPSTPSSVRTEQHCGLAGGRAAEEPVSPDEGRTGSRHPDRMALDFGDAHGLYPLHGKFCCENFA